MHHLIELTNSRFGKWGWSLIPLLAAAVIGCSSASSAAGEFKATPASNDATPLPTDVPTYDGVHIRRSADLPVISLEESARRADVIAIATVRESLVAWNTESGTRPQGMSDRDIARQGHYIFTIWEFQIEDILKGPESLSEFTLRTWGGEIENDRFVHEGFQDDLWSGGDRLVIFAADCGTQRAEELSTRYSFVNRFALLDQNTVRGLPADSAERDLSEFRTVVDAEKFKEPRFEAPCKR